MSNFYTNLQHPSGNSLLNEMLMNEDNPFHAEHVQQLSELMDAKIREQVPAMIQQQQEEQQVNIQTYLNGKPVSSGNIGKAVKDFIVDALNKSLRRR